MGLWARLTGRVDRSDAGRDRDVGATSKVVGSWWPGREWDPTRDGDPRAGSMGWDKTRPWESTRGNRSDSGWGSGWGDGM